MADVSADDVGAMALWHAPTINAAQARLTARSPRWNGPTLLTAHLGSQRGTSGRLRFQHRVNLDKTSDRLSALLRSFRFTTLADAVRTSAALPTMDFDAAAGTSRAA